MLTLAKALHSRATDVNTTATRGTTFILKVFWNLVQAQQFLTIQTQIKQKE